MTISLRTHLPLSRRVLGFGIIIPLLAVAAPAQAAITFDLSEDPETNFSTYTKTVNGLTLTISDPVATAFPAAGGLNAAPTGFCAFAVVGSAGGRCNYLASELPQGTTFNGFTMSFSAPTRLRSFEISRFRFVDTPTISFTSGAQSQVFTAFGLGSKLTFKQPFTVDAGSSISVSTAGSAASLHDDGVFRINNFEVLEVPGPLGVVGAVAAFRYSRKIRRALSGKG